ncbi:hypothetical protein Glove_23g44 [Diversispora epigaea]|uniref:Uncharacterized protein n=1 Tax=Diversispora epigaea TaxID=1348612 RepID=A0A397JJ36_9GLOM|nr:hypothetical protein Glove_23g44 [Diversispora epigaea]
MIKAGMFPELAEKRTIIAQHHLTLENNIYEKFDKLEEKFRLLEEEIDDLTDKALEIKVYNPLSKEQANSIYSDIGTLLISIDKYAKKKNHQRYTKSILDYPRLNLDQTEINLKPNLNQIEINLRSNLDQTVINLRPDLQL